MGATGGALVFLAIAGSFFGFMLVVAYVTTSARAPKPVRDYGWPVQTEKPDSVIDLLLRLVWGVVIVAALMTWPVAMLALAIASVPFVFGTELSLSEVLHHLLTAELLYGIVIAASLVVGVALFMSLLIGELVSERISERKGQFQDEP